MVKHQTVSVSGPFFLQLILALLEESRTPCCPCAFESGLESHVRLRHL